MKFLLPLLLAALPACSSLSSQQGHAEYRTPAVTIYDSPKIGKLSVAAVVTYDVPVDPDPPVYTK